MTQSTITTIVTQTLLMINNNALEGHFQKGYDDWSYFDLDH